MTPVAVRCRSYDIRRKYALHSGPHVHAVLTKRCHGHPITTSWRAADLDRSLLWSSLMHTVLWMSYDLGVKGDYEGLYAWLDDHGAAECGNSVAFLRYEYSADFLSELKEDIARHVNLDKRDRI